MSSGKPKKKTPRKPPAWLYVPLIWLCGLYLKLFYGLKIDNGATKGVKAPVLVLSNRQSDLDFLVVPAAVLPLRLKLMAGAYFCDSRFLSGLLKWGKAIPKEQLMSDSSAVRGALRAAAAGCNVALFPEGQACAYGAGGEVDDRIAKLIKKLGIPVVNIAIRGNFLTCPTYAAGRRPANRGRIECTASLLFTAEEIKETAVGELAQKTKTALAFNEFEWQRRHMIPYRPARRSTAGLENVLFRCAACGAYFTMKSERNRLECGQCGYSVLQNRYGFFEDAKGGPLFFDNPADWYLTQREELARRLEKEELLPVAAPCALYKTVKGKQGYALCGQGNMTLNEEGLFFEDQKEGGPFRLATLYKRQTLLMHSAKYSAINVRGEGENFLLRPAEDRMMLYLVELYSLARRWVQEKNERQRLEALKQEELIRQEELREQKEKEEQEQKKEKKAPTKRKKRKTTDKQQVSKKQTPQELSEKPQPSPEKQSDEKDPAGNTD